MKLRSVLATVMLAIGLLFSQNEAVFAQNTCDSHKSLAPVYKQIDHEGRKLVTQFMQLLQKKDTKGLDKFLSPAFNLQRADGTGYGKTDYLKALPDFKSFSISKLSATQDRTVINVRYLLNATGQAQGKNYAPGPAPRLSTFSWNGCQWQLSSHANFNAMSALPAAGVSTLLDKSSTTILGQQFSYPTGAPQITSSLLTMLPGQETGRHRHDAPMYAYILEGEVTVTYDGGIVKTYSEGMAIIEAVGTFHTGINSGKVPARLLIVNMGSPDLANTVKP